MMLVGKERKWEATAAGCRLISDNMIPSGAMRGQREETRSQQKPVLLTHAERPGEQAGCGVRGASGSFSLSRSMNMSPHLAK